MRLTTTCLLYLITVIGASGLGAVEPMERAVDTKQVWEGQAEQVVAAHDAAPVFTGMMVWSGRADRNYMPFFQWEIRLRGGSEDLRDLRLRVLPLGPDLSQLQGGRMGHWQRIGSLAAAAETDFSYMINTPIFPAYRVEMEWRGGSASYLATDRQMLPQREGALDDSPQLVVLDPIWERNARAQTMVGFWLRNQGGGQATGVMLTLRLRDGEGKVLLEHPYVPEDGTIPAGYGKEQRVLIQRTPPFHNVQIAVTSAEANRTTVDGGTLSDSPTVEVGEIAAKDGVLHGKLRNGTDETISGVEITIRFVDDSGSAVGQATASVATVAPGAIAEWQLSLENIPPWSGFETGLAYGVSDAAQGSGDNDGDSPPTITVEGVSFSIQETVGASGMLKISGEVHNHSGGPLNGLVISLTIPGLAEPLHSHIGDLADDERFTVSLIADGIETLDGLGMAWRTGGSEGQ